MRQRGSRLLQLALRRGNSVGQAVRASLIRHLRTVDDPPATAAAGHVSDTDTQVFEREEREEAAEVERAMWSEGGLLHMARHRGQ